MDGLIDGAQRAARDAGLEPTSCAFPVPSNCPSQQPASLRSLTQSSRLGVVIRGGTPPTSTTPARAQTNGLTDVSVLTGRPIGFGVLTCDNESRHSTVQAWKVLTKIRADEATAAALQTAATLKQFSN